MTRHAHLLTRQLFAVSGETEEQLYKLPSNEWQKASANFRMGLLRPSPCPIQRYQSQGSTTRDRKAQVYERLTALGSYFGYLLGEANSQLCIDHARSGLSAVFLCMLGSHFPPLSFDASWRTEAVIGVARFAQEAADSVTGQTQSTPMLVLADALEDAYCENSEILTHLRADVPHNAICWVLKLILGQS